MGRGFTRYSYVDVDLPDEWPIGSAFLDYILGDGTRLHVNQADCFCTDCDHFVIGERIETVAEIEHQIDQIQNHPESNQRKVAEFVGDIPNQIAALHIRVEWRKSRQSPPKCLHCGSTDISAIPDEEEFDHPVTGHRMKVSFRGFSDAAPWHATFTPEGERLD